MQNNESNSLVSVIIPTYKRSDCLLKTIDSVLNQTYPNIEIIVVDDNGKNSEYQKSTYQKLKHLIETKQITYIAHETNKNGSAARNTGFRASQGEYVNFLDDDDIFLPQKISKQVARLVQSKEDEGATYCNSESRTTRKFMHKTLISRSNCTAEGDLCIPYLLGKYHFNTSTILFKRSALDFLNGFDESYYRHQDFELMVRFFRSFKIVCTSEECLAIYDQTGKRINTPLPSKDILIKEKFLTEFADDFKRRGVEKEVAHRFWYECARCSLPWKEYGVFSKAIRKCTNAGSLSCNEVKILLYAFLSGIIFKHKK